MTTDRNWREVFSGAGQLPKDWLDTAQRWHRHFLLKAIPAILLTLVLGVGLNAAGWKEVNFLFALAAILGGLFFATQPKVVLAVFGVGTLWNGLLDAKVTGAKANLDQGLQFVSDKYVRPVGHVLLLTTVVFVFLGTYRIQNPLAILPLIVVVMGLGLWAALFASDTTWYRRITLKLLLAAGVMSLIGAYFYTPSRTEKLADEIRAASETNLDKRNAGQVEALKKFVAEGGILSPEQQVFLKEAKEEVGRGTIVGRTAAWFESKVYRKAFLHNLNSYHDQKICGIRDGSWRWNLGTSYMTQSTDDKGQPIDRFHLNGFMALNGTPVGEIMSVSGGCATLSFPSFNNEVRSRKPIPIPISIVIESP